MLATLETLPERIAPARAAQGMLWGIAGFTVMTMAWAGITRLPETAVAPGRVVPQRQLQLVSNLEGGTVTAILARPGQRVAAGELLLRLDPTGAAAEFGRGNAASQALRARIVRLEAELHDGAPQFPAALEAAAPIAVAAERALWSAHRADLSATGAGDAARSDAATRALTGAQADQRARAEASAQARREIVMIAPLVDQGIEPRISLDRARSAFIQAEAAEAAARAGVARAAAGLAEARAADRGDGGRLRSAAADALTAARAELAAQSAALPALQGRVERTTLRSPIAGTVQRVLATTIGGSVRPGEPLVEIVPAGDALVVEARVQPSDIGFVHAGQLAAVRLTAYDSSLYGKLEGRVTSISPDAVIEERSGESYYVIRIETGSAALAAADGQRLPIVPGMIVAVDLIGARRSLLSYLLSPVTRLNDRAFRER